ncbi:MAG: bifunctional diaminohydroxyphosphoribosylaminopyrimidine deaminase/5-amino-6-(5-phosphoribosylamino)uracil reductase RibD [bacterium]|nr:MAG: bifunctional diaminohydroxyphosphoribosylaminopyrimidine deaminase/5-amino-6-(5-phosphoribosylamino)uracil reductase RibD [bacterium]
MTGIDDRRFMARALKLAARGQGTTHPNPMVGAVVVKKGVVVGEGWHRKPGEPHAETLALQRAGRAARGATVYVNLEPCDHHGRTPPCTRAIIGASVARVVAACEDPHPLVSGRGIHHLREAGIRVDLGVLRERAEELNRAFLHHARGAVPYVTLKLASTLDGRIATSGGESRWITGEQARRRVHLLRAQADAVLVGVGTVVMDDPRLTVRNVRRRGQPFRVVLDPSLRTPLESHIVRSASDGRTLIVLGRGVSAGRRRAYQEKGVRFLPLPRRSGRFLWPDLARGLSELGVLHLLVEGGSRTAAWFLASSAVQRLELFMAPAVLGEEGVPAVGPLSVERLALAPRFRLKQYRLVGGDLHIVAEAE